MDIERESQRRARIGLAVTFILFCTLLYLATVVGPYTWTIMFAN